MGNKGDGSTFGQFMSVTARRGRKAKKVTWSEFCPTRTITRKYAIRLPPGSPGSPKAEPQTVTEAAKSNAAGQRPQLRIPFVFPSTCRCWRANPHHSISEWVDRSLVFAARGTRIRTGAQVRYRYGGCGAVWQPQSPTLLPYYDQNDELPVKQGDQAFCDFCDEFWKPSDRMRQRNAPSAREASVMKWGNERKTHAWESSAAAEPCRSGATGRRI